MLPADLRRWVRSRRAAAEEERRLAQAERPSAEESFERALDLIALSAELHGWPLPEDPQNVAEDHAVYERWSKLRRRLAHKILRAHVRRPLVEALAALERALSGFGAPHMIIGGIAIIARGVARQTDDIDATVWAEGAPLTSLIERLGGEGIVGRIPDFERFARERQVLLMRHEHSRTPMEITLAWLPFEKEALAHAEPISLQKVIVPVATAEDLVIYKAIAWRDRDRADVERLLRLHRGHIDLQRVRRIVQEFAEALEEPERMRELDDLIARS